MLFCQKSRESNHKIRLVFVSQTHVHGFKAQTIKSLEKVSKQCTVFRFQSFTFFASLYHGQDTFLSAVSPKVDVVFCERG